MPITIYETADLLYRERPELRPVLNGGSAGHTDLGHPKERWEDPHGRRWLVTWMGSSGLAAATGPIVALSQREPRAAGRAIVLRENVSLDRAISLAEGDGGSTLITWLLDRLGVLETWPRFD